MKKRPFQEQLSKFSLLGQLPKVKTGLEEAWKNLKKCTEPFTAQDIIKQQQETINRQKKANTIEIIDAFDKGKSEKEFSMLIINRTEGRVIIKYEGENRFGVYDKAGDST